MKYLNIILIGIIFSCRENPKWVSVHYKLEDGTEINDKFELSGRGGFRKYNNKKRIFFTNVINEVAEGNKSNINSACFYGSHETVINSILLDLYDFEEKHYNAVKFLLEQGALVNLLETNIFGNIAPNHGDETSYYNPKNKKIKVDLPITFIGPKSANYQKKFITKLIALFLNFGSKINLKDSRYNESAIKIWNEELKALKEYKKFLTQVSKDILKLKNKNKLDPDFLKLLRKKNIDSKLIESLENYELK